MINILDLLRECGIETRKASGSKGGEYHSACPGCGDGGKGPRRSDRFHAWPAQNDGQGSWWCRQCGKGGDCIQFMMDYQSLDFKTAAARAGKTLDEKEYQPMSTPTIPGTGSRAQSPQPEQSAVQSPDLWREKADKLVAWAHDQLKQNPDQLAYLASRGLGIKAVERFHLGWLPADVFRPRESWGLPPGDISEKTGKPKKLWIPSGLVIPFLDSQGRVERVRIRRPEGDPRYYVVPGGPSDPIPLLAIPSTWPGIAQALIVCEAELDAMLISTAAGDLSGVLSVASSSAKPRHEDAHRLVTNAAWIGLALDRDQAGEDAMQWWLENFENVKDIRPPGVKDPGELVSAGRDVRAWVESVLPPAWRSGRAAKKAPGPGKGQAGQATRSEGRAGAPATVRELGMLLSAFPRVRMEVGPDRWALWAKDEQGREIYFWDKGQEQRGRRLHDLFWFDPMVEKHMADLGPGIYGRDNFLKEPLK